MNTQAIESTEKKQFYRIAAKDQSRTKYYNMEAKNKTEVIDLLHQFLRDCKATDLPVRFTVSVDELNEDDYNFLFDIENK